MVAVRGTGGGVAARVSGPGFGGEVAADLAGLDSGRKDVVGRVAGLAFGGKVAAKVMYALLDS